MSTDRSVPPFRSLAEAGDAVAARGGPSDLELRLLATIAEAERRACEAEHDAATDVLTSAASRRAWERMLVTEERRCARYGHVACVIALDVDGMKAVNDREGHRAGDQLLQRTAGALDDGSRATDLVARVGGDEFAVLAVDTDLHTGRVLMTRLAEALADVGVRASLGLAERDPAGGLAAAWSEADRHMYSAKRRRQAIAPAAASASTATPSTTR